jgi:enoyl-CoA hydratase
MNDIHIRMTGRAGRITLQRPDALNAMTYEMCTTIEAALIDWQTNDAVDLVIIDALGTRAFCAGGDIADLYQSGLDKNYAFGQKFWADEYRLNALIAGYPKPFIALMQGFTMGGGVGISCHGSHRIVGETSQIAMPECGIGLVPDVGGSYILSRAPGYLGEYLGLTADRMGPRDAILVGFADHFIPQDRWARMTAELEKTGNPNVLKTYIDEAPAGTLADALPMINAAFKSGDLSTIASDLSHDDSAFAERTLKAMRRNSPLSMACALKIIGHLRNSSGDLKSALRYEYRFTARAMEFGDFLEGIRAAIIDKDRTPNWQHNMNSVPSTDIEHMLGPLGALELHL